MRLGLRPAVLAVAGSGCVAAAVFSGCVVAPPAELSPPSPARPTILQGSVSPPPYQALTAWTVPFVVPVQLGDVNASFEWSVFVDYDGDPLSGPASASFQPVTPTAALLDGGVYPVTFTLEVGSVDLTLCHRIEFQVGHAFVELQTGSGTRPLYHSFDDVGSDSVAWEWSPPGCYVYGPDVGAPADASADSLPVPPSSGDSAE